MMNCFASLKWLVVPALLVLASCGSGGGGGGGGGGSSPPPVAAAIAPNAGADRVVNVGEPVVLNSNTVVVGGDSYSLGGGTVDVVGKSLVATDVVRITWSKLSGPPVALSSDGTTKATARFVAPSTGAEPFVTIEYQLTFYYGNGTTATDQVSIRVNRVNQLPQVTLAATLEVEAQSQTALNATAIDTDGRIASYVWEQTAGTPASLSDKTSAQPLLTAPTVSAPEELTFSLKVTDNDGAVATATIKVKVLPTDAPRIAVYFPHPGSNYLADTLVVSGQASAKEADVQSLLIKFNGVDYPANLKPDGSWRAENIAIPAGMENLEYSVLATDSLGRQTKIDAAVTKKDLSSADYLRTDEVVNFAIDAKNNRVIVLSGGNDYKDFQLFTVDITTGKRSSAISDFSNLAQGVNPMAVTNMVWDSSRNKVYAATAPADTTKKSQIITIDVQTGQRSVLSDSEHGTGVTFTNPTGLAVGHRGNLYVADNVKNIIASVDLVTGDRTVVADATTLQYEIDAPVTIAIDPEPANARLFLIPYTDDAPLFQVNLASVIATTSLLSQPNTLLSVKQDPSEIIYNPVMNEILSLSSFRRLLRIDLKTGNRIGLENELPLTSNSHYQLDVQRQVMYVTTGIFENLYALDIASGSAVQISRNNQSF